MIPELRRALEALPGARFVDCQTFSGPSPFSSERVLALTFALPYARRDDRQALETLAAWCMAMLLEAGGATFDAGVAAADGEAVIWAGYDDLRATQLVIAAALSILSGDDVPLETRADALLRAISPLMPDSQARIMMAAAKARSIPVLSMFDPGIRQFGWGAKGALFWETTSNRDGVVGHVLSRNKASMKEMIARLGLPTPPACLLPASDSPAAAVERLGWPLVVKPLDRGSGKGVTADIRTTAQLEAAVARARSFTSLPVLVERHAAGADHRLMVVDGRLVAAVKRVPASVVGDGRRNVGALIDALNAVRRRDLPSRLYLKQIAPDPILIEQLAVQGLGLDSVPSAGEVVRLRSNANRSTGGECIDATASVHPEVAAAAVTICEAIGLRCAGIDYLTEDISKPPDPSNGSFIEVNTTPALSALAAAGLDAAAIAGEILGDLGRVPSTLVVAPPQAWSTLTDKLREALKGRGVSWVCGGAARIDGRDVAVPHRTLHNRAAMLVSARQTREITIVCSADEVMKGGLPLDRFDLIILCEELPPDWQGVVERHSARCMRAGVEQINWRAAAG